MMPFSQTTFRRLATGVSRALVIILSMTPPAIAQKLATLEVVVGGNPADITIPVSTNLDGITHVAVDELALHKIEGSKRTAVPFQVNNGRERTLTWLVSDKEKSQRFELTRASKPSGASGVKTVERDGALVLAAGNKELLSYNFEVMKPPAGVNEVFGRSGFIHPLRSPKGHVLTRIQPPDHYHHYGVWNPWTHALYDGDTVDFWNLNARQGTVRFANFLSVINGEVFGEYSAIHDHIAFKNGKENTAIRELQTVRVYAPQDNYYIADITVDMNIPGKPVRLLEYRYGGLGWRATEQWTKENSRVLTSEGKTRKDADGSIARWCIVDGTVDGENAGIVMMSYPTNYNHPEPLRIWPENANRNRGDMFANFSPTKNKDWQLDPGENYVLKYRFIVFDGQFSKEQAEAAWQAFASPPIVKVSKN